MLTPAEEQYLVALEQRRAELLDVTHEIAAPTRPLDPHQVPPEGDWLGWVMRSGRGGGKTFAGMDWLNKQCVMTPGLRCRVIAPTYGDGVASCVEGIDGLLVASNRVAEWRPSAPGGSVVVYPNGSKVWIIGTNSPKDVDRLRALTNIDIDVFEEAFANPRLSEAIDQANMSRRRGLRRFVVTSTPRPHPIWARWEADPRVVITRATMMDNTHNDPEWVAEQIDKYKGTRLYRQEILGEVLDDVEGALWTLRDIERSAESCTGHDQILKYVVGVDPPSGSGTCGIVIAGASRDGHAHVIEDRSVTDVQPYEWAMVVAKAARDYGALVVAEKNQGGRMVTEVLRQADPAINLTTVTAAQGKTTRAEPVALLWEAETQSAHLCEPEPGDLAKLVDELTSWVPDAGLPSPDRMDAMVWAVSYLRGNVQFRGSISVPTGTIPSTLRRRTG